ncbi:MAG: helix-turn-helix transcriptional regulator [Chloroflexi bacterium]|nr:helix-turn-helix transcriptional regulator [Chloroflexota bacterium]
MKESKIRESKRVNEKPEYSEGEASFRPRLHGDFLASSLLAFLRQWNAYGYQLVQELSKAGLPFDSATVYRTLRNLERAGLVSSFWDTSASGPARRMYSLTRGGETILSLWIDALGHYQRILRRALGAYEEQDEELTARERKGPPQRTAKGGRNG